MTGELHDFQWEVPASGFRWVVGGPVKRDQEYETVLARLTESGPKLDTRSYLVSNSLPGTEPEVRTYDPVAVEPSLFRTFADTEPSRKGILEFANRYGSLGLGTTIKIDGPKLRSDFKGPLTGEPLGVWARHIGELRDLVHLLDLHDRGDIASLSEHISWSDKKDSIGYRSQPDNRTSVSGWKSYRQRVEVIARTSEPDRLSKPKRSEGFDRFTPDDVLLPAIVYIQRRINEHLDVKAFPRLLWDHGGRLSLRFPPASLINMLWLQFADSVSGNVAYRACPSCNRWVRLGPDASRTSRLFCSNACRTRGLRERQRTARSLRSEGKSIETIAEELNSDVQTVTRWVVEEVED